MIDRVLLFAVQYEPLLQTEEVEKFPWWLVLLILAIVIIVVIWALTRNTSSTETPYVEHDYDEYEPAHVEVPAAEVHVEHEYHAVESAYIDVPVAEVHVQPAPIQPPLVEEMNLIKPIPAPVETPALALPVDLKLIEGIDPKIAEVLNNTGILTFAQLADTPVSTLQAILDQAGLHLGDPASWPEQARLAEIGDLEGLQALQDSLKGGRNE